MRSKVIALLLITSLTTAVLSGCQNGSTQTPTENSEEQASDESGDKDETSDASSSEATKDAATDSEDGSLEDSSLITSYEELIESLHAGQSYAHDVYENERQTDNDAAKRSVLELAVRNTEDSENEDKRKEQFNDDGCGNAVINSCKTVCSKAPCRHLACRIICACHISLACKAKQILEKSCTCCSAKDLEYYIAPEIADRHLA